jgi:hypothetical protein
MGTNMNWHPILLGIIDDPYSNHFWMLPLLSIVGSLLCFYRYRLGWVIVPIVSVVSVIFLVGFLEPENYRHITSLSDAMPRILISIVVFFAVPIIATYFSWRRLTNKLAALP